MKKTVLLTTMGLFACTLSAQLVTDEMPYGLKEANNFSAKRQGAQALITLSAPNRVILAREDSINDSKPGPVRYACPVEVSYTLENSGVWQQLEDSSKIWRLKVKLPGALSIDALYDKFWLPDGAKFFVYSEETKQYIGAITSEHIGGTRKKPIAFATAMIYGESVVFEYCQPASVSDSAVISISRIDYGYRYVKNPYDSTGNVLQNFGDAANCNINVNCSEGSSWQTEKHAVARVKISGPDGSGWCSCALVNNTNNDGTPYVLTANHCLNGLDAEINSGNASQCVFYWEFEHPGCSNTTAQPTLRATTGATVVANNSNTDFALFLLTQDPRNASGVVPYYLGWDRSGNAGTSGVGIHHPRGDVKKISATNQIQNHSGQINWEDNPSTAPNTHWNATFYNSLIETGSSGSPLINNNRRLIGQLHGGLKATCDNNTNYVKYYGKFNVSWTGNGAADNRRKLQPWLDPAGTNPTTLDGKNGLSILGASTICDAPVTYTLSVNPAATSWSVEPASAFQTVTSSPASITVKAKSYNETAGTLTATVNGVSVTKAISTCKIEIEGSTNCVTGTYTLSKGSADGGWTLSDPAFTKSEETGTSVVVSSPTSYLANATLTARVNGVNVTRPISSCSITISGPGQLNGISACSGSYSVSTEGLTSNLGHPQWTIEPVGLQSGVSGNGLSVTFSKTAAGFYTSAYGDTLTATLTFSIRTVEGDDYVTRYLAKKAIKLQKMRAPISGVYESDGTTFAIRGFPGAYYKLKTSYPVSFTYQWSYSTASYSNTLSASSPTVSTSFPSAATYTISLKTNDGCGWGNPSTYAFPVVWLYQIHPNPVEGNMICLVRNTSVPQFTGTYGGGYEIFDSNGTLIQSSSTASNYISDYNVSDFNITVSSGLSVGVVYILRLYKGPPYASTTLQTIQFMKKPQ